jgi:hypothetical protein
MIDTASYLGQPPTEKAPSQAKPHKVLYMVENERMAGKVPEWRNAPAPQNTAEAALTQAQNHSFQNVLDTALAYNPAPSAPHAAQSEEFGFRDIIDMANPLHHIPIIGHIYREITGDEIKPIGQIIGGGIFGGPAGAATGLVSAIVEAETGEDVASNAMSFVTKGQTPDFKSIPDSPEARLNQAADIADSAAYEDLPASLLSFVAKDNRPDITMQRIQAADGRTAGHFHAQNPARTINEITQEIRDPITQIRLSGLYALADD